MVEQSGQDEVGSRRSAAGLGRPSSLSVVVPVFKSAATLGELVDRLQAVLRSMTPHYEVLLINDGSPDDSWRAVDDMAKQNPEVRGIDLRRNYGQHNALLCGIRAAKHEVIITIDDDLQHPPEEIPKLLYKLAEGYDVVYGTPLTERHGLWRDVASRVTKLALSSAMGTETARNVSAFRALRTGVRDAFQQFRGPFVSVDVLLTWGTTRFAAVPVRHDPRRSGRSSYTFRKLLSHALNMMTGFSTLPLQLASLVGLACAAFGLCAIGYVVGRYIILGGSVPGFPFLASIIAIFSGAQLFALGIIGEYLARMHFRSMERPAYVARRHDVVRASHEDPSPN